MAQSLFQDPPQAEGNWTVNMSKMAVLFWQWVNGQITPIVSSGGMTIPANDEQLMTYYSGTNNLATITYKQAGQVVATQVFEYVGGVPVADDADIARITIS